MPRYFSAPSAGGAWPACSPCSPSSSAWRSAWRCRPSTKPPSTNSAAACAPWPARPICAWSARPAVSTKPCSSRSCATPTLPQPRPSSRSKPSWPATSPCSRYSVSTSSRWPVSHPACCRTATSGRSALRRWPKTRSFSARRRSRPTASRWATHCRCRPAAARSPCAWPATCPASAMASRWPSWILPAPSLPSGASASCHGSI